MYRLAEYEVLQMAVPVVATYPDALNQAKNEAVAGIKEMLDYSVALMSTLDDTTVGEE